MNEIGIDYGRVGDLQNNVKTTKDTISGDLDQMIGSVVGKLRQYYTGGGGESIANALETAATKAKTAIEEWMTSFESGIENDKTEMAAKEAAEKAAGESFVA